METPTPVSALMHAGIVNAGGLLLIRWSSVMVEAPVVLGLVALIGATTAVYAGLVMLTQTDVKRKLAYSTVAQMGFMMMQCGLGAFSAAALHLVAHSFYKAYAFLASGAHVAQSGTLPGPAVSGSPSAARVAAALGIGVAGVALATSLLGVSLSAKPGGWVIGTVLALALAQLLTLEPSLQPGRGSRLAGLLIPMLVPFVYLVLWSGVDAALALPLVTASSDALALQLAIAVLFVATAGIQLATKIAPEHPWLRRLHVGLRAAVLTPSGGRLRVAEATAPNPPHAGGPIR